MSHLDCRSPLVVAALALAAGSGCGDGIRLPPLTPEEQQTSVCTTGADLDVRESGSCPSLAGFTPEASFRTCRHKAGDWTLVVPAGATLSDVAIVDPPARTGAVAVDWTDQSGSVAGLVVAIPDLPRDVQKASRAVVRRIEDAFDTKRVVARATGRHTVTHDGFDVVAQASLELTAPDGQLHKVRNQLYPVLLGLDTSRFEGRPDEPDDRGDTYLLLWSVIQRSDRHIVSMAVALKNDYTNHVVKVGVRADDLGNGTMVGRLDARTKFRCREFAFEDHVGAIDMLWVVDDDPGNDPNRSIEAAQNTLHNAVGSLWQTARNHATDLRMAVVGTDRNNHGALCRPTDKPWPGCQNPDRGRFWTNDDADRDCFRWCLRTPSYGAIVDELGYGLRNGKDAMFGLLPRTDDSPTRWRTQAQRAVIYVSDRPDRSVLAQVFGGSSPLLPISQKEQQLVDTYVWTEFAKDLSTEIDTGSGLTGVRPYAFVKSSPSTCKGVLGIGYLELVNRLDQPAWPICAQADAVDARLEEIMAELVPAASTLHWPVSDDANKLPVVPVSATLRAALDGLVVARSRKDGFDYNHARGRLVLVGARTTADLAGKNALEATYVGW